MGSCAQGLEIHLLLHISLECVDAGGCDDHPGGESAEYGEGVVGLWGMLGLEEGGGRGGVGGREDIFWMCGGCGFTFYFLLTYCVVESIFVIFVGRYVRSVV